MVPESSERVAEAFVAPIPVARPGAYEVKFLLDEGVANAVLERIRHVMLPDPHASGTRGDEYRVHSLYADTLDWSVIRRQDGYRGRKYRLRRYGDESLIYLERKSKSKGWVQKRRTVIAPEQLAWLTGIPVRASALARQEDHGRQGESDNEWAGAWFHRRLHRRRLLPRLQLVYDRAARVLNGDFGPMRLTLDRRVHAQSAERWEFNAMRNAIELLPGQAILELKYRDRMPEIFRALIDDFALTSGSVSKYRLGVAAFFGEVVVPVRYDAS